MGKLTGTQNRGEQTIQKCLKSKKWAPGVTLVFIYVPSCHVRKYKNFISISKSISIYYYIFTNQVS